MTLALHPTIATVPADHHVAPAARPTGARREAAVYRRRRVAAAVVLVVALGLAWLTAVQVTAAWFTDTAGAGPAEASVVVVQPGDTMWSIAESLEDDGDVRATVDRLIELNGSTALVVGQRLVLPAT